MIQYKKTYKYLLLLLALVLTGCHDDEFFTNDSATNANPDVISFSAYAVSASGSKKTRSSEDLPEYEALVLIGENDETPLYLHMYETDKIGYVPGEDSGVETRANQIKNAENLIEYHNNFKVLAQRTSEGSHFFEWQDVNPHTDDNTLWNTSKTYYWPGKDQLTFFAVSPSSEFGNLSMDKDGNGPKIIDGKATLVFDYTARRYSEGSNNSEESENTESYQNRDAELQPDLLIAASTYNKTTAQNGVATLKFSHALSAVKFAVRDVMGGKIKNIKIKGVHSTGTCRYTPAEEDKDDDITDIPCSWSVADAYETYSQNFDFEFDDRWGETDENKDLIINDGDYRTFMMIPQEIPQNAEIEVEMETYILDENGNPIKDEDGQIKKATKIRKGKIRSQGVTEWKPGHEYVYTISTSKDNWTYVFEVFGSVQEENEEDPSQGVWEKGLTEATKNNITINPTVTEGASYTVKSYRYQTNKPSKAEIVAWTATSTNGENQGYDEYMDYLNRYGDDISDGNGSIPMTLTPSQWFPGKDFEGENANAFGDCGSIGATSYDLTFKTQYVATNWEGDWEMRAKKEFNKDSDEPLDLSIANLGDGTRNTANCYVVNRGGWYKFPLVYGNAITKGLVNENSYIYNGSGTVNINNNTITTTTEFNALTKFTDYKGQSIESPYINRAVSAKLVWQDAYNIIDNIELIDDGSEKAVKFHVARQDLQQSNSVIAVCDVNEDVIWSWHIWVNEYLVNESQNLIEGIECETWDPDDEEYGPFEVAIRNLGWCDAKTVEYLERTGEFNFRQAESNKSHTLIVTQRPKRIEFYVGNNTYYQWGRKDPMVGFRYTDLDGNNPNLVKYNFGNDKYGFKNYGKTDIQDGIQNPNLLLSGVDGVDLSYWEPKHYFNLWNNKTCDSNSFEKEGEYDKLEFKTATPILAPEYKYSGIKTIYDPSPAGFMVPPLGFFELFTNGRTEHRYAEPDNGSDDLEQVFNGKMTDPTLTKGYYQYNASSKRRNPGETITVDPIMLTATGQRWHRQGTFELGGNMNPKHIYLWTNSASFYLNKEVGWSGEAFSFVLGNEKGKFISTNRFMCRKTIARPVRSVKEKW